MSEVLVLCYHAVSPNWPAALSVSPDALERQLSALVRAGWLSCGFTQAVMDPPYAKTLSVTFDDAFASVDSLGEPVLRSLGLTATVFTPTAYIANGRDLAWDGTAHWEHTPFARELKPMSWEQLRSLRDEGWEIGSHTSTHRRLPDLSDDELRIELESSKAECERRLEGPCPALAYPYGQADDRVEAFAAQAGYQVAGRLTSRLDQPAALRWPRVGIYHDDADLRFRLKVSPQIRRLRASPLWARLR